MKIIYLFLAILLVGLTACKKDKDILPDDPNVNLSNNFRVKSLTYQDIDNTNEPENATFTYSNGKITKLEWIDPTPAGEYKVITDFTYSGNTITKNETFFENGISYSNLSVLTRENGNIVSEFDFWQESHNDYYHKYYYDYTGNNLTSARRTTFNSETSEHETDFERTFYYEDDKLIKVISNEYYGDTTKRQYIYTYTGDVATEIISHIIDFTNDTIIAKDEKYVYEYSGNNITRMTVYDALSDGSWELERETTYTYNENNKMATRTMCDGTFTYTYERGESNLDIMSVSSSPTIYPSYLKNKKTHKQLNINKPTASPFINM